MQESYAYFSVCCLMENKLGIRINLFLIENWCFYEKTFKYFTSSISHGSRKQP